MENIPGWGNTFPFQRENSQVLLEAPDLWKPNKLPFISGQSSPLEMSEHFGGNGRAHQQLKMRKKATCGSWSWGSALQENRSASDSSSPLWSCVHTWPKDGKCNFQHATLLENRFFKLTAFKSSLLNAPWIKTILFTPILFHLPTIKLLRRMIHLKQRKCFGRGPLLKHEICRINPMAAGVMWHFCQTHSAIVVNFIMTSFAILL